MEHVRRLLHTEEYGFTDAQVLGGGLKIHTTLDLRMQRRPKRRFHRSWTGPPTPRSRWWRWIPKDMCGRWSGAGTWQTRCGPSASTSQPTCAPTTGAAVRRDRPSSPLPWRRSWNRERSSRGRSGGRRRSHRRATLPRRRRHALAGLELRRRKLRRAGRAAGDGKLGEHRLRPDDGQVVTPAGFVRMAELTGISIPRRDLGCALTLGTTDVTPLEMARAYTTFAARGARPR